MTLWIIATFCTRSVTWFTKESCWATKDYSTSSPMWWARSGTTPPPRQSISVPFWLRATPCSRRRPAKMASRVPGLLRIWQVLDAPSPNRLIYMEALFRTLLVNLWKGRENHKFISLTLLKEAKMEMWATFLSMPVVFKLVTPSTSLRSSSLSVKRSCSNRNHPSSRKANHTLSKERLLSILIWLACPNPPTLSASMLTKRCLKKLNPATDLSDSWLLQAALGRLLESKQKKEMWTLTYCPKLLSLQRP